MGEVYEHKCVKCGGTLNFDAKTQMVTCPYCDTVYEVSELQDADTKAIEVNDTLTADAGSDWAGEDSNFSEYNCESCGGEIYCDENTSATVCPYCGSNVILKGRLSGSLKPDRVIPFKTTLEDAKAVFRGITKGKAFAPSNFIDDTKIEEVKGMYVPYWVYDADLYADIKFKAMREHRWMEGDTEVVEKNYYAVGRRGDIAFDHVPADGSSKLDDTMMESLEPFLYSDSVDFQTAYLSGFLTDKYDVDNETAAPRAFERMRNTTESMFEDTVLGYDTVTMVDSYMKVNKSSSEYVLYPVWTLNAKFEDKNYMFAMNGQTGKMVGNLPRDGKKAAGYTIGTFLASMILFTLLGCLIEGTFDGLALVIGLGAGAVITAIVYFVLNSQLKMIRPNNYAGSYYRDGSMKMDDSYDWYLYRTTHRYKRNSD